LEFHLTSTIFALISFGILFLLLKKFAFGPLFGVMERRQQMIREQIETAENNRKQAEELLKQQQEAIQNARKEAYDIIEQAKQVSSRQAEEMIAAARAEASRIKEEALREIESEKAKAVSALRSQVSAMSVLIASKIIEKQLDEQSHKDLVEKYLSEVGGK
jgi:F-type H+-transporting ATPase subunit b